MAKVQVIRLEGCENCRDLGGNITKWGALKKKKVIRAAQLNKLSESDLKELREYGVKKILDLRGIKEREMEPDVDMNFADNIHVPIFYDMRIPVLNDGFMKEMFPKLKLLEEVLLRQRERMLQVYKNFVTEQSAIIAYRKIFEVLIENNREGESVLFHCTAGKDRTGFVAALIMSALDVDKSEIMKDYLLTNEYLSTKVENTIGKLEKIGVSDKVICKARGYFMAKEEYLEAAFRLMEERFGSVNEYLRSQLKLTENKRAMLYDNYNSFSD